MMQVGGNSSASAAASEFTSQTDVRRGWRTARPELVIPTKSISLATQAAAKDNSPYGPGAGESRRKVAMAGSSGLQSSPRASPGGSSGIQSSPRTRSEPEGQLTPPFPFIATQFDTSAFTQGFPSRMRNASDPDASPTMDITRESSRRKSVRMVSAAQATPSEGRRKKSSTVFVDNPKEFLQELKSHEKKIRRGGGTTPRPRRDSTIYGSGSGAPTSGGSASSTAHTADIQKVSENIKVAVRIRPRNSRETSNPDIVRVCSDGRSVELNLKAEVGDGKVGSNTPASRSSKDRRGRVHSYDFVFDSRPTASKIATQGSIYHAIGEHLVKGAIDGYNACLFAYGQTGTGKTHTVIGHSKSQEDRGLLPRILEAIYVWTESCRKEGNIVVVKISFLEIYNEMIRDLLVPPKPQDQSLSCRYTPKLGLVIDQLTETAATTVEEAYELLDFGMKMRSIAATSMNSRSSRAHTVFTFRLEQGNESGDMKLAQVQIIDLAGREQERTSGDVRERVRERAFINKSLFHLSTCISNLARNKSGGKIPEWTFRNSKLTMVLTNSLGKNSRTAMLAAISPSSDAADETISTLRFASQVITITTQASCNSVNKRDLVAELQQEIQRLKEEQGSAVNRELQEQVAQLEALCEQYRESLEQEKDRAAQSQAERKTALTDLGLSVTVGSSQISVSTEQDTPYLVNLSEDPFLEGCLMYFLKTSEETTVGSADDNRIRLVGLGIVSHHCEIHNEDNMKLRLRVVQQDARTFLNGRRVTESAEIQHKDRLILGHAFAFKVHVPLISRARTGFAPNGSLYRQLSPRKDEDEEGLEYALAEVEAMHLCTRFVENLSQKAQREFEREMSSAVALVDEANLISREVRPEDGIEFRLQVVADVLSSPMPSQAPAMIVAVTEKNCEAELEEEPEVEDGVPQSPSNKNKTLKFVWSYEKFKDRLQAMRDIYEELQSCGREEARRHLRQEPYIDPWKEIGNAEVQMLLHGLSTLEADVNDGHIPKRLNSSGTMDDTEDYAEEDSSDRDSSDDESMEAQPEYPESQDCWFDIGRRRTHKALQRSMSSLGFEAAVQVYEKQSPAEKHFQRSVCEALAQHVVREVTQGLSQPRQAKATCDKDVQVTPVRHPPVDMDIVKHDADLSWIRELDVSGQDWSERDAHMQKWSAQIEAKESVLKQLQDGLQQLRALEKDMMSTPTGSGTPLKERKSARFSDAGTTLIHYCADDPPTRSG